MSIHIYRIHCRLPTANENDFIEIKFSCFFSSDFGAINTKMKGDEGLEQRYELNGI